MAQSVKCLSCKCRGPKFDGMNWEGREGGPWGVSNQPQSGLLAWGASGQ